MRFSYKRGLTTLVEFAHKEGFKKVVLNHKGVSSLNTINTGTRGSIKYEPVSIFIEKGHTLENKAYFFLHELGHYELRKNWKKFKKRFPTTAYAEYTSLKHGEDKYMRRNTYVVASLEEEFSAWDEGLRLAERLGIRVNMTKWVELKTKCLKAYINYYAVLKK